jgi:antitoxin (DNA-binding transcriptional repressor) of toxin-antitoxin stability system
MKVSAQYAEEHFADLASAATRGEEVEIEVYGKPSLVLVQRHSAAPFKRSSPVFWVRASVRWWCRRGRSGRRSTRIVCGPLDLAN